ncbi:MAG: Clp protease ClpP [Ignavibacteriales bacterium]|nr:Clp protease ClpP [Ignavibacteriales bacterium]
MGYYSEYLLKNLTFQQLNDERKKQLKEISKERGGRDIIVIAADLNKPNAPTSINYSDLLPVTDQLSNLKGSLIDVVLETPGGYGEVAEDIVKLLHEKYNDVAIIIPGYAKSAGTIIAMAGDEILMDGMSSLGPIDAQITWQGKVFSAEALLEGIKKIKEEVTETGSLNKAYIPILQGISPGELQNAQNALDFAKVLVGDWLYKYKFKKWAKHSSTGQPVTDAEKRNRANEIASHLCKHSNWLTHGRSIKIADLKSMKLEIIDYSCQPKLAEAIRRYYALLQMTFVTNIYKVFETPDSQIFRFTQQNIPPQNLGGFPSIPKGPVESMDIDINCGNCKTDNHLQINFKNNLALRPGRIIFPRDNQLKCKNCGKESDLGDLRRNVEAQTKQKIID